MIKTIAYPGKACWPELTRRPVFADDQLTSQVETIINDVRKNGDAALIQCAARFEQAQITTLLVSENEFTEASAQVSEELKAAIQVAKQNIEAFHQAQRLQEPRVETMPGVLCWRKSTGIEKVGLYIPGGSAPLFSTLLMLGIPAKLAGCRDVVLCTPCNKNGLVNPVILYVAGLLGITRVYKAGGAQAIAAMAYGTESIPQVYKLFGPGNQYVTRAKTLVQQDVAIDLPAGPSEVLVIADDSCDPEFVAADLLSQAEHGADSQVLLLTNSVRVQQAVEAALQAQLQLLPRKEIAAQALGNSCIILLSTIEECIAFSNCYAPEHLILAVANAAELANHVHNAGSVFLGNYSCESAGDYASGTNHTLPTNGAARCYSGVSLGSFQKKISFQEITPQGLQHIGKAIETMAEAEQLLAHKQAVSIRLKKINYE